MKPPIPNSQDTAASASASASRARAPGLTAALLSATPLAKVDKAAFLGAYLRSQSALRGHFVQEGLRDQRSWDRDGDGVEDERDEGKVQDAVFSTPKLKARVPEAPRKEAPSEIVQDEDAAEHVPESTPTRKEKSTSQATTKVKKPKPREPRDADVQRPRSPNTLDKYMVAQSKTKQKRQRSRDSDREAVLAERRERRRAKKAIVDPKRPAEEERDEDDHNESASKRTGSKSGKAKSKTANLAASLALMHGFSASNVGPGRLTLKPSYGVFQKGKASVKTKVSRSKQKPSAMAWSELEFLGNKGKVNDKRKRRSRSLDNSSSNSSEKSSAKSTESPKPPQKKFKISNYKHSPKSSRKEAQKKNSTEPSPERVVDDLSGVEEGEKSDAGSDATETPARGRGRRPESIVWDIERDDMPQSPGGDDARESVAPTRNGTLILDTSMKWSFAPRAEQDALPTSNQPDIGDIVGHAQEQAENSDRSSLCPSHSASQAGRHAPSKPEPSTAAVVRSKYFSGDSLLQDVAEAPVSLLSVPQDLVPTFDDHGYTPPQSLYAETQQEYSPATEPVLPFPGEPVSREHAEAFVTDDDPWGSGNFVSASMLPRHPELDDSWASEAAFDSVYDDLSGIFTPITAQASAHPAYDDDAESSFGDASFITPFPYWSHEGVVEPEMPLYEMDEVYSSMMLVDDEPCYDLGGELVETAGDYTWEPDASYAPQSSTEGAAEEDDVYTDLELAQPVSEDPPAMEPDGAWADFSRRSPPAEPSFSEELALLRSRARSAGMESVVWAPRGAMAEEVGRYPTVSRVEEDVAKALRNHWLPQRL